MGGVPENSYTLHRRVAQQLPHIILELSLSTASFLFDLHVIFVAASSQKRQHFKRIASPFATIIFFFSPKHNQSLLTSGKAEHFSAEGRKLRSIYSARAFHGVLGNLGSYGDLASVSAHGPYAIFRGKTTMLSACCRAARQLGLGRRAGISTPILIKKW